MSLPLPAGFINLSPGRPILEFRVVHETVPGKKVWQNIRTGSERAAFRAVKFQAGDGAGSGPDRFGLSRR